MTITSRCYTKILVRKISQSRDVKYFIQKSGQTRIIQNKYVILQPENNEEYAPKLYKI